MRLPKLVSSKNFVKRNDGKWLEDSEKKVKTELKSERGVEKT